MKLKFTDQIIISFVLILLSSSAFGIENTHKNVSGPAAPREYVLFESDPVRPLALSHDGKFLFVTNVPDSNIEMYAVSPLGLTHYQSIPVGLEPVAVAITKDDSQLWVVNHLSDSISIIDLTTYPAAVEKTLLVGDEPRDIVFAGKDFDKAFITTAYRGQNRPVEADLYTGGIGRADVWVFDVNKDIAAIDSKPKTIVNLFGDTPRPLAVSSDGSKVYAGIFKSGNQTTVLPPVSIAGVTKAPPYVSADDQLQPVSGLIVKFNGSNWVDELQRSFSNVVGLKLPDYDVFEIDANQEIPIKTKEFTNVGTVLFNLAVQPTTGDVYVSNIDSRNHIRFEGNPADGRSSVRGNLADNQITIIDDNLVSKIKLNNHLDFSKSEGSEEDRNKSLSMPMQMQFSKNGEELYFTAFGSNKIAKINTSSLKDNSFESNMDSQVEVSGGGPAGLVLDSNHNKLYVYTRFDNGISSIDIPSFSEINHLTMHNPEPNSIQEGRPFFYDARKTSGFGNDSCATCHIFGDNDQLAWDLGNPDETVKASPNSYHPISARSPFLSRSFHPMKGPMTTQSMRGLVRHGPQHWRGDRTGIDPKDGESLEEAAFKEFNGAYDVLLAKPEKLTAEEMQKFTDYAMQLTYPPNPNRNIDNSLSAEQIEGKKMYDFGVQRSDGNLEVCASCHPIDPSNGIYGTTGQMADNSQPGERDFKIPHFRNQYTKIGMFTRFTSERPEQIRGFAFNHNGATSNNSLFNEFGVSATKVRQIKSFLYAFPTESPPIVGQQLTLNKDSFLVSQTRLNVFYDRAKVSSPIPECDLTLSTVQNNTQVFGLFDRSQNLFIFDDNNKKLSFEQLKDEIKVSDASYSFTCQPWGSGERIALDRDRDGIYNSVERANGSNSSDFDSKSFQPQIGLWYNPLTSGRGLDIQIKGNNLTVVWYTHRLDGTPIWYLASAPVSQKWQAEIYEYRWNSSTESANGILSGNISIDFNDYRKADFKWSLDGNSGSESIQAFRFKQPPSEIDLTGLWYDPNQPGWGASIDTQGDTRVVVVYSYDENNLPTWVISQSKNSMSSSSTPKFVTGACSWCEYISPTNSENGMIKLDLKTFDSFVLDFLQNDKDNETVQWQRQNITMQRFTDSPY